MSRARRAGAGRSDIVYGEAWAPGSTCSLKTVDDACCGSLSEASTAFIEPVFAQAGQLESCFTAGLQ